MKMRLLLSVTLLGLALAGCANKQPEPAAKVPVHWSYSGEESPAHWGDLSPEFTACKNGQSQSPVNIEKTTADHRQSVKARYAATQYKMENNGHTIQVSPLTNAPQITLNNEIFTLKQFHFHTPSEHTFKDKQFPMEIHFVYQSDKGELAVLAVMVTEGKANTDLGNIVANKVAVHESINLANDLNIGKLIPRKNAHFVLTGSLTTPPCTEGVHWVIYEHPITASQAQIKAMETLIGQPNNRPLQPLNSRLITEEK